MYPRFIRETEEEERTDAAASFRLALEREKHHRTMFKDAFQAFKA
jgi:rubrerythrin